MEGEDQRTLFYPLPLAAFHYPLAPPFPSYVLGSGEGDRGWQNVLKPGVASSNTYGGPVYGEVLHRKECGSSVAKP